MGLTILKLKRVEEGNDLISLSMRTTWELDIRGRVQACEQLLILTQHSQNQPLSSRAIGLQL